MALDHGGALAGASLQTHEVAGVIVQHCQRMTARSVAQGEAALEVHLPKRVGGAALETLPGRGRCAGRRADLAGAGKDRPDGAARGQILVAQILQAAAQLARSPGGLRLAQSQDRGHRRLRGRPRAAPGPPGTIRQRGHAPLRKTLEPLVAGAAADAKTSAQLTDVGPGQGSQSDEFVALGHGGRGLPAHAGHCYPCVRSIHAEPVPTSRVDRPRRGRFRRGTRPRPVAAAPRA